MDAEVLARAQRLIHEGHTLCVRADRRSYTSVAISLYADNFASLSYASVVMEHDRLRDALVGALDQADKRILAEKESRAMARPMDG